MQELQTIVTDVCGVCQSVTQRVQCVRVIWCSRCQITFVLFVSEKTCTCNFIYCSFSVSVYDSDVVLEDKVSGLEAPQGQKSKSWSKSAADIKSRTWYLRKVFKIYISGLCITLTIFAVLFLLVK